MNPESQPAVTGGQHNESWFRRRCGSLSYAQCLILESNWVQQQMSAKDGHLQCAVCKARKLEPKGMVPSEELNNTLALDQQSLLRQILLKKIQDLKTRRVAELC
ncbi:hypothetical protein GRJ2_001625200 [Grus japonensis]|uniref:Uncharacterized protein n=1 Tax=Grus japonensis TaxID=30415 RepID=A0ABC9X1Z0_GRUJA